MTATAFSDTPTGSALLTIKQRLGPKGVPAIIALAVSLLAFSLAHLIVSLIGGDRLVAPLCSVVAAVPLAWLLGELSLKLLETPEQRQLAPPLDGLTGVMPRGPFISALEREWALSRRHDCELSVAIFDIDHLARVNMQYGKRCGDEMLRRVARSLSRGLRRGDVLARFGGEEFIVLLPRTETLGALDLADRLRMRVAGMSFEWLGHRMPIFLSVGVVTLREDHALLDQLLHEGDLALQAAKRAGRNCVRAADCAVPAPASRAMRG
ncbi:GGDEF domain-containing protein [Burkholderiaceae bacterium UC74_6]